MSAKVYLIHCPCCRGPQPSESGGYEICERCGWENDPVQLEDPDLAGGANKVSLSQAQANYKKLGWHDPESPSRPRPNPFDRLKDFEK